MQVAPMNVNTCNYLHEAALAASPPSGSIYDPEGDGTPLQNLGVHEHWNNAMDRKYSRDLGAGEGIEFIRAVPSLTVVTPNGGERLNKYAFYPVTWEAAGISIPLNINLWREGLLVGTIAENVNPAAGSYSWRVGNIIGGSAPEDIGYKIKIKAPGILYDASDAPFTLVKLKVKAPNGGESLGVGSPVSIFWGAGGSLGFLKISLWQGSTRIGLIADKLDPNLGVYHWSAGSYIGGMAPAGSGYSIRIHETGTSILDHSDGPFTLR